MTISDNDDWPVQESRMAKAKAHHERTGLIGQWCSAGHIAVMEDNDPRFIRLRIEDEFFSEPRDKFPSTTLIAKLQLAIHAGRSCTKDNPFERPAHLTDAMRYATHARAGFAARYDKNKWWAEAVETGYHNVAKITATVKPRRPRP